MRLRNTHPDLMWLDKDLAIQQLPCPEVAEPDYRSRTDTNGSDCLLTDFAFLIIYFLPPLAQDIQSKRDYQYRDQLENRVEGISFPLNVEQDQRNGDTNSNPDLLDKSDQPSHDSLLTVSCSAETV